MTKPLLRPGDIIVFSTHKKVAILIRPGSPEDSWPLGEREVFLPDIKTLSQCADVMNFVAKTHGLLANNDGSDEKYYRFRIITPGRKPGS